MMKKFAKAAAAVVLGTGIFLSSLTACSSAGPEAVVATVNGEEIYRWEVDVYYQNNKKYYEDNSDEVDDLDNPQFVEERLRYRKDILETLIDDTIVTLVAKDRGYDLSDEEKAEVDKELQAIHDQAIETYKAQYPNESDAEKKAEEDWKKSLKEQNMTEEFLRQNMYNAKVRQKFSEEIFQDLQPTEEELKEHYDKLVETDKEKYKESPNEYVSAASVPGGPVFYNPPGFVRAKQIMFSLPEEIDQQIRDISSKWSEAILESDALKQQKGSDSQAVQDLQTSMDGYNKQTEELYEQGYAEIKPRVDECYEKLKNGADFDEMIAEYGDDPSMTTAPLNEYGYLVGPDSGLVKGFEEGALALENVGDISEPVESIQGYHIIQLVDKIEEGPVPYEECKDIVRQYLVGQPQMNQNTEVANEGKAETDENGKPKYEIKRYYDRLG